MLSSLLLNYFGQGVALDEFPRVRILQTSGEEIGQIYIPVINWLLMVCCIGLVVSFRSSGNLAGAYGLAVMTTMVITTFLAYLVAKEIWGWPRGVCLMVTAGFLVVDFAFSGANILKIFEGGWFPLAVGAGIFAVMITWPFLTRNAAQPHDCQPEIRPQKIRPALTLVHRLGPRQKMRCEKIRKNQVKT